MTELIMEVNEQNEPIGLRPREDFYTAKYIHRGTHVILRNSKGEILVQKRSLNRARSPGKLSYSAGGTVGNETYREAKEEIGLDIQLEGFLEFKNFSEQDKVFQRIFFATSDEPIVSYQTQEIDSIERVKADILKDDIIANPDKYSRIYRTGMKIYFDEFHGK